MLRPLPQPLPQGEGGYSSPPPLARGTRGEGARSAGHFITFEGGEGAGKTTQARQLGAALESRGVPVLLTREPGGAPGAEVLRGLLLSTDVPFTPLAQTFLHFAARAEHVERTIAPALRAGVWVICDRFTDSTIAYQGWGLGVDRTTIASLGAMIGLAPDLTIILDVTAEAAAARLASRTDRPDRYEQLGAQFHARVAEGFRAIARAEPRRCAIVDANADPDSVHAVILDLIRERFALS